MKSENKFKSRDFLDFFKSLARENTEPQWNDEEDQWDTNKVVEITFDHEDKNIWKETFNVIDNMEEEMENINKGIVQKNRNAESQRTKGNKQIPVFGPGTRNNARSKEENIR